MSTKYRVCRCDLRMKADHRKLKQFLNRLEGENISIVPNVTWFPSSAHVNFLFIVEKIT